MRTGEGATSSRLPLKSATAPGLKARKVSLGTVAMLESLRMVITSAAARVTLRVVKRLSSGLKEASPPLKGYLRGERTRAENVNVCTVCTVRIYECK